MYKQGRDSDRGDFHVFEDTEQLKRIVRSLFHNSFEAAMLTTPEIDQHKIIFVNPAFCKMTGYQEHELIGQSPRMLQGEKTNQNILDRLKSNLAENTPFHGAAINYKKDGDTYHVEWKIHPVYDLEGNLLCYFSLQQDLSYLKSFLNRIKSTTDTFRTLLKNVHLSPTLSKDDKVLKDAFVESTKQEVENLTLFSSSLRSDEDVDLFDDELFLDCDEQKGMMPVEAERNLISAEAFHESENIDSGDILNLCGIIEDCIFGVEVLKTNPSNESARKALVSDMQDFANILFFMDEFVDLSAILGELSRQLNAYQEEHFPPLILDFLAMLIVELNSWVTSIFVEKSSANIHELHDSLTGSVKQILMFIKN